MEKKKLVCVSCGGDNVQIMAWVNPNGNVFIGMLEGDDNNDTWCEDCQDHTGVEEEKD